MTFGLQDGGVASPAVGGDPLTSLVGTAKDQR